MREISVPPQRFSLLLTMQHIRIRVHKGSHIKDLARRKAYGNLSSSLELVRLSIVLHLSRNGSLTFRVGTPCRDIYRLIEHLEGIMTGAAIHGTIALRNERNK